MTGMTAGSAALAMVLAYWGSFPLGLPPEPENPAMAYVAPEECLFYISWTSMADADPQSANHTEQLLADEEVRRFAATLQRAIALSFRADRRQPRGIPRAEPLEELAPLLARTLVTRSTAIFVEDVDLSERRLKTRGGMLVEAGDQASAIVDALAEFLSSERNRADPISLGKVRGHRLAAGPGGPPVELTLASAGPYVLIGVGEQSLEGMIQRLAAKKAPAWHTAIGERLPVQRRASIAYVNAPALLDKLLPLGGPEAAKWGDSIGVKQVGEAIAVVGLDDEGIVSRSLVKLNGPPSGFVKLLDGEGIQPQDLEFLPRDALFATAVKLNADEAYKLLGQSMAASSPEGAAEFERFNAGFERQYKLRLREDVLAALGDVWTISASSVDGWLGTTATVEVKDRETIDSFVDTLVRSTTRQPVEVVKHGEFEIHSPLVRNEFLRPAWCVTENRLIVGPSIQAVKGALATTDEERGLFRDPKLGQMLDGDGRVISVGYQDTAKIFESFYSYLPIVLRVAEMNPYRDPNAFNALSWLSHHLPPARSIHRHLQPSVSVTRLTKDGIETQSRSTVPAPNIGASAPFAVALLVPAVQAAQAAAMRTRTSNNLKQIMIAIHNHHDAFRQIPPAYRFDKNKRPGLSWRVMILPYIEQQALFAQFRLDEPWDSEHNRALIAKMPDVYRSPASEAEEGKTVYLGVGGESGVFPPLKPPASDRNPAPIGTIGMASITDGTSNTIAVVEANDDSAVIWTKPDDFTPDPEQPFKGLLGLQSKGFMAGMMDGSVRLISDQLDPEMLMRLFQRNDGQVVDFGPGE